MSLCSRGLIDAMELFEDAWSEAPQVEFKRTTPVHVCDCFESNEAYYGKGTVPIRHGKGGVYQVVPTIVTADGICQHCNHYSRIGTKEEMEIASRFRRGQRGTGRRAKKAANV